MKLVSFTARNFRNISECDIAFTDGVNLLLGENAQGKTNVIEGIYLFSRGKSFRSATDKDMTNFEKEGFHIGIRYTERDEEKSLSYAVFGNEKRRMKNGYRIDKPSEMIGSFRAVLFCPDHLGLVKDGPEQRRRFLDIGISSCHSSYLKYYANYKHALEERNCLLKLAGKGYAIDRTEILAWSDSLAEYASYIYKERMEYSERIAKHASRFLFEMSEGEENMEISYLSDIPESEKGSSRERIRELYYNIFSSDLAHECAVGTTLYGPTRDELEITVGGKKARQFASQGQQRSIVLSLKWAEGEVCRELSGEYPVFLFDDVLSELDEKRRRFILSGMKDKQMILTACNKGDVFPFDVHTVEVERGHYVSSHR